MKINKVVSSKGYTVEVPVAIESMLKDILSLEYKVGTVEVSTKIKEDLEKIHADSLIADSPFEKEAIDNYALDVLAAVELWQKGYVVITPADKAKKMAGKAAGFVADKSIDFAIWSGKQSWKGLKYGYKALKDKVSDKPNKDTIPEARLFTYSFEEKAVDESRQFVKTGHKVTSKVTSDGFDA